MKKIPIIFVMVFCYGLICTYSSAATPSTPIASESSTTPAKPVIINKFLQFVLPANSGVVLPAQQKGSYELKLMGVDANVVYFTNKPRRIVGSMTTAFFLKRWVKPPPRDFISNPPNALVTYVGEGSRQTNFIVQLTQPIYNEQTHALSFVIKPLQTSQIMPSQINKPVIVMSEVAVCGVLGAWGNLPGEKQYDVECHAKEHE